LIPPDFLKSKNGDYLRWPHAPDPHLSAWSSRPESSRELPPACLDNRENAVGAFSAMEKADLFAGWEVAGHHLIQSTDKRRTYLIKTIRSICPGHSCPRGLLCSISRWYKYSRLESKQHTGLASYLLLHGL
jgi:hypothetical protein